MTRRFLTAALTTATILGLVGPAEAYPRPGETELVSRTHDGQLGNVAWETATEWPALTPDGRLVAFHSSASNMVPGDTNQRADIFLRDRDAGTLTRISVGSNGEQSTHDSWAPRITPDGRFVAFESWGNGLWPGDAGWADVFVHDRKTGQTVRISNAVDGGNGNESSFAPAISNDGRWIAFSTDATNMAATDINGDQDDIFLHDRFTNTNTLVSKSSLGLQGDAYSGAPAISGDGGLIAFDSRASNLVVGDTNGTYDIFVHERVSGQTSRVSLSGDGAEARGASFGPRLSADGRYVAFSSDATNLVPSDTNGATTDVLVHDRQTGETRRVNVSSDGVQANDHSGLTGFSASGRYVLFLSYANNLVPNDVNDERDVFLHDMETGTTEMISVAMTPEGGNQESWGIGSVTPDGRHVGFMSVASNIVPGDTNEAADVFVRDRGPSLGIRTLSAEPAQGGSLVQGQANFSGARLVTLPDAPGDSTAPGAATGIDLTGASITFRPELGDLQVRLSLDDLPRRDAPCPLGCVPPGSPGVLYGFELTRGAVRYEVRALAVSATAATPGQAPYFGLYKCDPTCAEVGTVKGGIGSTEEEVVFGLPLSVIGASEGDTITSVRAFTAAGEASLGVLQPWDELAVGSVAIPRRSVSLGVGPDGARPEDVAVPISAGLSGGDFAATVPAGERVFVRACLGQDCSTGSRRLS